MAHETSVRTLQVSLLATANWRQVARAVLFWGHRVLKPQALAAGYKRAECRAIEGHDEAEALLQRLGFVCEAVLPDYGECGQAFKQYAWRRVDHVLDAENPQAPGPSAGSDAGGR
jgi:RimJ/RimL family protein N-acetyltransferase